MQACKTIFLSILLFLIGCNTHSSYEKYKTRFFSFKSMANEIILQDTSGCSSQFTYSGDTVHYNLSSNVWNLAEEEPQIVIAKPSDRKLYSGNNLIFVSVPYYDVDTYRKQNVFYQKKGSLLLKISRPRINGRGMTGVYIDSVTSNEYGKVSFNMYAENLDSISERKLVELFTTIDFLNRKIPCQNVVVR
jgi:hypothetical protein